MYSQQTIFQFKKLPCFPTNKQPLPFNSDVTLKLEHWQQNVNTKKLAKTVEKDHSSQLA